MAKKQTYNLPKAIVEGPEINNLFRFLPPVGVYRSVANDTHPPSYILLWKHLFRIEGGDESCFLPRDTFRMGCKNLYQEENPTHRKNRRVQTESTRNVKIEIEEIPINRKIRVVCNRRNRKVSIENQFYNFQIRNYISDFEKMMNSIEKNKYR